jgi:hypothetical protein
VKPKSSVTIKLDESEVEEIERLSMKARRTRSDFLRIYLRRTLLAKTGVAKSPNRRSPPNNGPAR